jgi:rhodanese-related sulfurtransferase
MNRLALVAISGLCCVVIGAYAGETAPELLSQDELIARQRANDASLVVVDVRTAEEYAAGHVPGAINIPHDQVVQRLSQVPTDKDLVLYCRSGRRTAIAADVLAANGYTRLEHLEGDIAAWLSRGLPLETPVDQAACVAALVAGEPSPRACAAPPPP